MHYSGICNRKGNGNNAGHVETLIDQLKVIAH